VGEEAVSRESKRDPYANEPIEVTAKVLQETDKALLVTEEVKDEKGRQVNHWLPKSQIDSQDWEIGKVHTITMPRWLFESKGFTNA
jgi:hypothetical protein